MKNKIWLSFVVLIFVFTLGGCDDTDNGERLTIDFVSDGETPGPMEINLDATSLILPESSKSGYAFEGWFVDESLSEPFEWTTHDKDGDFTLYASFEPIEAFTLTYQVEDSVWHEETVGSAEIPSLPDDPVLAGYVFDNWYLDDGYQAAFDPSDTVEQDLVLYARFLIEPQDESVFEDFYESPVDTMSVENVIVVEKTPFMDTELDMLVFFDGTTYMLATETLSVNVGDKVSFDATFSEGLYISGIDDLVVHSSDNPVFIDINTIDYDALDDYEDQYEFIINETTLGFYEFEGFYSVTIDTDNTFNVYDESLETYLEIYNVDDSVLDEHGYGSIGTFYVPNIGFLYSPEVSPLNTEIHDDATILAMYEALVLDTTVSFKPGESFRHGNLPDMPMEHVLVEGSVLYDSDKDMFMYSEDGTSVTFELTVSLNDESRTFEKTVAIEPITPSSISDLVNAPEDHHRLEAEVFETMNNNETLVVYDGEHFMEIFLGSINSIEVEMGNKYVFLIDSSNIEAHTLPYRVDGYAYPKVEILSMPVASNMDYQVEILDLDAQKTNPGQTPFATTLEGTLTSWEHPNVDYTYFGIQLDDDMITLLMRDELKATFDEHLGSTIRVEAVFAGYNEYFDSYNEHSDGYYAYLVGTDIEIID